MVQIDRLSAYAIFGGVSDPQLILLSRLLRIEQFSEGAYLLRQGERADRLHLIQQGQVEVLSALSDDTQVRIAICRGGDSIGEMAMVDRQPHAASVRALEPVTTLSLSVGAFGELQQQDPQLYTLMLMNLARELSRRLRAMDQLVASTLFTCGPVEPPRSGY